MLSLEFGGTRLLSRSTTEFRPSRLVSAKVAAGPGSADGGGLAASAATRRSVWTDGSLRWRWRSTSPRRDADW